MSLDDSPERPAGNADCYPSVCAAAARLLDYELGRERRVIRWAEIAPMRASRRVAICSSVLAFTLVVSSCAAGTQASTASTAGGAATTSANASGGQQCRLSPKQKHAVAASLRDIRQLHRLELRTMTKWSQKGTPAAETLTGKTLDDIEIVALPVDTKGRLLRLAKAAIGLCGLCFQAFEAEEPAVSTRLGVGTPCNAH